MKSIANKMCLIQAEFPAIPKGRRASVGAGGGYNYRGIDDALAALNPLLAKHRVFMTPDFEEVESTKVETSSGKPAFKSVLKGYLVFICGDTGEEIQVAMMGEGMDNADKAIMKAQANALKYAIWYTFCVPTSEVKDSEAYDH